MKNPTNTNNEIQTWKKIALSVNDQWNQNSTWQIAQGAFGKLKSDGNPFIESVLSQMFGLKKDANGKMQKGWLSEKQAYFLAKYGVESGQLN